MCNFLSGKIDDRGVCYFSNLFQHEGIDDLWKLKPDQAKEFEWRDNKDDLEIRITDDNIKEGKGQKYWLAQLTGQYKTRDELLKAIFNSCKKKNNKIKFNINAKDNNGDTALIWASYHGHKDIALALIKAKANVTAKDNNGYTALILASRNGQKDIVELLKKHGAE